MEVSEKLCIKNFYTIEEFDWDIREFNILTGGMGSGKSICVKLLWFLERIFHTLIFYPTITKDDLGTPAFFDNLAKEFNKIFYARNFDFSITEIVYTYSYNKKTFDLKAVWDKEKGCLSWSSVYLDERLKKWQDFFGTKDSKLDTSIIVSNRIYKAISKDFDETFPVGTMFIPASRAIAAITDNTDFADPFIVRFLKNCKSTTRRLENFLDKDIINKILHIKDITYDDEVGVIITLLNGCEIQTHYLSSGQQELLYLLLLVGYLKHSPFNFTDTTSVFIEEPSAHLFPQDQKRIIEYIVETFRILKDNENKPERFFITTHSPYILNVVSTMMNRGKLKRILEKSGQPSFDLRLYFNQGEISAYYIDADKKVRSMLAADGSYLKAEKINDISQTILDEANSVDDALAEIEARNIG